jgi:hypothetical protein
MCGYVHKELVCSGYIGIPHVPWDTGMGWTLGECAMPWDGAHGISHVPYGTLGQCAMPWDGMDITWDPMVGHWDSELCHGTVWTSHGIPHVPWDTGTVCYDGTVWTSHGIPHVLGWDRHWDSTLYHVSMWTSHGIPAWSSH